MLIKVPKVTAATTAEYGNIQVVTWNFGDHHTLSDIITTERGDTHGVIQPGS
jgi:hypothetical protein